MASKEQIEKAILQAAGDPAVGEIKDLASAMAEAVWLIDNAKPTKEVRVVDATEVR